MEGGSSEPPLDPPLGILKDHCDRLIRDFLIGRNRLKIRLCSTHMQNDYIFTSSPAEVQYVMFLWIKYSVFAPLTFHLNSHEIYV